LKEIVSQLDLPTSKISYKIVVGHFLNDIGKIASTLEASLIILGTKGAKGLQKVFGSHSIKIVSSCKIPVIIVQEHATFQAIRNIAMTIDLERESIQIVKSAAKIGALFNSKVILIGGKHSDPDLKQKVELNINLCRQYLEEHSINADFELLERKDFEHNLLNYCQSNDVDILAATYYMNTFQVFSEKFVQVLANNELHIPLLTIDSETTSSGTQYGFLSV
jgi:K+-sensing histidine kinase KdpD